jgi:DNA-binding phage protein
MTKQFGELADRVKSGWSDDTRRVHEAVSADFVAELDERAQLGALLAAARKANALTQPALSELTGVQQAEISRIERGVGNPTAATLVRLADALGQKLTLVPAKG